MSALMAELVRLNGIVDVKGAAGHPHALRRLQVPLVSVATWRQAQGNHHD
jgi:hypothetical protein